MSHRTRLRRRDALAIAFLGIRMRRLRATLSALGVAIGISAIVAVTGVSASSRADVIAQLDRLGTNLLTVAPGNQLGGGPSQLPTTAAGMIGRISLVQVVARVADIDGATVRRSPYVPSFQGGGIGVRAADPMLLRAIDGSLRSGVFLNAATAHYPVVVIGSAAAAHLGIDSVGADVQVWIDDRPFLVVGILDPVPLVPDLDHVALIGWQQAEALGFDGSPTGIFVRTQPDSVTTVRAILARTSNPPHPDEVLVSRPSDALAARSAVSEAFTYLLLALGVVALLVAAVGIINVMLIAILERRTEIGLRRALGASRSHIVVQFLGEAVLITGMGGVLGCAAGAALTAAIALVNGWQLDLPPGMFALGLGAAIIVGTASGAYPAWRASRLPPMDALRSA